MEGSRDRFVKIICRKVTGMRAVAWPGSKRVS
jgi:hypothetical protein